MSFIERFERRLEGAVDNTFARIFGGSVVPAEVESLLRREAESQVRRAPDGRYVAPHRYVVALKDTDLQRLSSEDTELSHQFERYLNAWIADQGWTTVQPVSVSFTQQETLHTGQLRAQTLDETSAAAASGGPYAAPSPSDNYNHGHGHHQQSSPFADPPPIYQPPTYQPQRHRSGAFEVHSAAIELPALAAAGVEPPATPYAAPPAAPLNRDRAAEIAQAGPAHGGDADAPGRLTSTSSVAADNNGLADAGPEKGLMNQNPGTADPYPEFRPTDGAGDAAARQYQGPKNYAGNPSGSYGQNPLSVPQPQPTPAPPNLAPPTPGYPPAHTPEPTTSAVIYLRDGSGRSQQLPLGSTVIGRGQNSDFRLPDTGVSRRHAQITWDSSTALLTDLGSTNGTLVNGGPVGDWQLAPGDLIRIGHSELLFQIH